MTVCRGIWAIAHNKGGVGKTTSTVNLAWYLAQRLRVEAETGNGRPGAVLIVDLDPQGNSADALGLRDRVYHRKRNPNGRCLSFLLGGQRSLRDSIISADRAGDGLPRPNLYLLPASRELEMATEALIAQDAAAIRRTGKSALADILNERLGQVRDVFTYVLLDCPPKMDSLKTSVYNFADAVIVPIVAEYLPTVGAAQHTEDLFELHDTVQARARLRYILPTRFDGRLSLARSMLANWQDTYGREGVKVAVPIREAVAVAEAPGMNGKTLGEYAPNHAAALAYQWLAREMAR